MAKQTARADPRLSSGRVSEPSRAAPPARRKPSPRRGLDRKRKVLLVKVAVWAFGLLPGVLLAHRYFTRGLGSNPIEAVILHLGDWSLIMLLAALAVTPLRRLTGWNVLVQARRPLGLFAFFWVCLHLLSYIGLDQFFAWEYILEDILERPFITVGMAAFLLLLPLALTSTRGWIRRLGKNWTRLHRAVYVAAALAVLHFFWKVKADEPEPLIAAAVLGVLLVLRIPAVAKRVGR